MMKSNLSIIICTHNPQEKNLTQVLVALEKQTLPFEQWELVIIDNASKQPLATEIDLSWHPNSRIIREEKLGLTSARLRGIQDSYSDILIFVDDDNVLEPDYLETALQISKNYSYIGAWGGQILPLFEEPPAEWTKPYWEWLAIRTFERDKWTNMTNTEIYPCGAGLCVRRFVAVQYCELVQSDSRRLGLDRKGDLLFGGGDLDLSFTACDMGLGIGMFTSLKLTHLIPPGRLQQDYLIRLAEANAYSNLILSTFREKVSLPPQRNTFGKLIDFYRLYRMSSRDRQFHLAKRRGATMAYKEIFNLK